MNPDNVENHTTKSLREFQPGDTLYIRKNINGFSEYYYCEFIGIIRGVVGARIIYPGGDRRFHHYKDGQEITAKAYNCFLWGEDSKHLRKRCWWFKDTMSPAE